MDIMLSGWICFAPPSPCPLSLHEIGLQAGIQACCQGWELLRTVQGEGGLSEGLLKSHAESLHHPRKGARVQIFDGV